MEAFWAFVEANTSADPGRLRLKYHGKQMPFDVESAITQIECRQRYGKKLAGTLADNPRMLFPSVLSGEQSTSDSLARWHSREIAPGTRVIDCTAGLGIDAMHMHACGARVTAVDTDPAKCEALSANCPGIQVVCADCREFLHTLPPDSADLIYIDPARRGDNGQRLFALSDCSPDVTAMLPAMSRVAPRLVVKASPMLDITHTALSLPGIRRITALGTPTECKELVCEVDLRHATTDTHEKSSRNAVDTDCRVSASYTHEPDYTVASVTITADGADTWECTAAELRASTPPCSMPMAGQSLYEPSPTAMKAGMGAVAAIRGGLAQLHPNTHLFTGTSAVPFPGREYTILAVMPWESRRIKRLKKEHPRMQVATRNLGLTADQLRQRLGVADSPDLRLYGVTLADGSKAMILCR